MAPILSLQKLVPLLLAARLATAILPDGRLNANMKPQPAIPKIDAIVGGPVTSRNGTVLPPYDTTYTFDQLIDHNNPSLGTFKQRFWHTYEFYEPGGPIILMTPGEGNADGYSGYLTNLTINGLIAQQQNGSTILIEHRFYGLSNPLPDLSVKSLQLHTIQQAIEDLVYFAQNVHLPMPGGDQVSPDKAPWILTGGSYAGALTSWTMVNQPGIFKIGYASSAVVEAITDFWGYFEPVRQNMAKNCSADVEAVIAHVDKVFTSGNTSAISALKENFGLGSVTHLDDAAGALRNNLWEWQDLSPTSGQDASFFQFCDALEVKNGVNAPATGWGLDHALSAWGSYWTSTYLESICGGEDAEDCLGTYDLTQTYWSDTSVDNAVRSWLWIVCNEVGFLQESAPVGRPTLVSRIVQPIYDERQCQQMFPEAFSSPPVPRANVTNAHYKGWNVRINNLFFANGQRDPWRDATVSADGVNIASTTSQPIAVGDGYHCSDLITFYGITDATIGTVQKKALSSIRTWMEAYTASNKSEDNPGPKVHVQVDHRQSPSSRVHTKPVNAWAKGLGGI